MSAILGTGLVVLLISGGLAVAYCEQLVKPKKDPVPALPSLGPGMAEGASATLSSPSPSMAGKPAMAPRPSSDVSTPGLFPFHAAARPSVMTVTVDFPNRTDTAARLFYAEGRTIDLVDVLDYHAHNPDLCGWALNAAVGDRCPVSPELERIA